MTNVRSERFSYLPWLMGQSGFEPKSFNDNKEGKLAGTRDQASGCSRTGRFSYSRQGQVMVQPSRRIFPLGGVTRRPPSSL